VGPPTSLHSVILIKISYAFITSHMHATWPAHLIVLDFIILTMFGESIKLRKLLIRFKALK